MIADLVWLVGYITKLEKATLGLRIIWHNFTQSANSDVHPKINWSPIQTQQCISNLIASAHHFSPQTFWSHSLRNVHQVSVLLTVNFRVPFFGNFMETFFFNKCNSAQAFSINSYRFEVWTSVRWFMFCFHKNSCFWVFFFFLFDSKNERPSGSQFLSKFPKYQNLQ